MRAKCAGCGWEDEKPDDHVDAGIKHLMKCEKKDKRILQPRWNVDRPDGDAPVFEITWTAPDTEWGHRFSKVTEYDILLQP